MDVAGRYIPIVKHRPVRPGRNDVRFDRFGIFFLKTRSVAATVVN